MMEKNIIYKSRILDENGDKIEIKSGDVFGKLKAICICEEIKGRPSVKCLCECGNTFNIQAGRLLSKNRPNPSCGCVKQKFNVGNTVNKILLIEEVDRKEFGVDNNIRAFICKCFCGNTFKSKVSVLINNENISCGCLINLNPLKYEYNDKIRECQRRKCKLDFTLTLEEFTTLSKKNCYYCGKEPSMKLQAKYSNEKRNGIDRIDSNNGYVKGNCVTSCWDCNKVKLNANIDNFFVMIKNIYENLNLINCETSILKVENKLIKPEYISNYNKKDPYSILYNEYIYKNDHQRKLDFSLTKDEFELLIKNNCYYCNKLPSKFSKRAKILRGGVDRIDSKIGYIWENCIPSCFECNLAKMTLNVNKFLFIIKSIYENLKLNTCNNEAYVVNVDM